MQIYAKCNTGELVPLFSIVLQIVTWCYILLHSVTQYIITMLHSYTVLHTVTEEVGHGHVTYVCK